MGVYTQRFASEDDYEAWLAKAGPKITVLAIRKSFDPRILAGKSAPRPVELRYQTSERALKPRHMKRKHVASTQWKLAPVYTFGALVALLAAYAIT